MVGKRTTDRLWTVVRLGDSLLVRMAVGVLALIAVMSAIMFLGIDFLVSMQFRKLHDARVAQYAEEVRRVLDRELKAMSTTVALIAKDSDLNHSAQYHLLLRGEPRELKADIERVGRVFQLDSVALWNAEGNLVAGTGRSLLGPLRFRDTVFVEAPGMMRARVEWVEGALWLVAATALRHRQEVLAWLQIGRPIDHFLRALNASDTDARVRIVAPGTSPEPNAFRFPIGATNRDDVVLEVTIPSLVESALFKTKQLLGAVLILTSLLLAGGVVVYLRSQFRPVRELTRIAGTAADALRSGEPRQIAVAGHGEVAQLTAAFNGMMRDLAMYNRMERELRHKEQLSAIGKVATQVAHDINNPLTVIKNTALLLKRENAGADLHEDLDLITRHCERCHRIVDNLLRFGRPLRLNLQRVELRLFLRDYLARRAHGHAPMPYDLRYGPREVWANVDPYQVEQMLDNILDNAYEANGGNSVVLELAAQDEETVLIRITDHGPGFDSTIVPKVFDFYFTTKPGGTGLGLTNSLAIARAHGGDIAITAPAQGEVTIWLPRAVAQPELRRAAGPMPTVG
jgi:signal transduction histidine kinase